MAEESWKKAIKTYLEAIDLDDQREEFHAGIALAYEKIGNLRKSETHYRKSANCGLEQSRYWCLFISFLLKNKLFERLKKHYCGLINIVLVLIYCIAGLPSIY